MWTLLLSYYLVIGMPAKKYEFDTLTECLVAKAAVVNRFPEADKILHCTQSI